MKNLKLWRKKSGRTPEDEKTSHGYGLVELILWKRTILPKAFYSQWNPDQNLHTVLYQNRRNNHKTHMEAQKILGSQSNLEQEEHDGGITLPSLKFPYRDNKTNMVLSRNVPLYMWIVLPHE